MDNLTHSLAGWVIGEAGLKRKTGLAIAALVIGANLPDIDALAVLFGENLAFRRGITHGPLAMAIMVPGLAGALLGFDRWQARRGTRPAARPPVRFGWLLLASFLGVLSHPALDWLNVYGIRCLMPFSEQWFYGDTLFIIDIWVWLMLAIGIGLARQRGSERPARVAAAASLAYVGLMAGGTAVAEHRTHDAVIAAGYGAPRQVVANPPPIDPFTRQMIYDLGDRYGFGEAGLFPPRISLDAPFANNRDHPALAAAAHREKLFADYLYWSRLPMAEIREVPGGTEVRLTDARFLDRRTPDIFRIETVVPAEAP